MAEETGATLNTHSVGVHAVPFHVGQVENLDADLHAQCVCVCVCVYEWAGDIEVVLEISISCDNLTVTLFGPCLDNLLTQ